MSRLLELLPWLAGGLFLLAVLVLARRQARWAGKLLARTGVGLAALAVVSKLGALIGVTLGVNLANALVLGLLGAPGFGLLLMMNWVLR